MTNDDDSDLTPLPPPTPAERESIPELDKLLVPENAPGPVADDVSVRDDRWDRSAAWLIAHGALPALAIITIAIAIIHGGIFYGETAGDDLTFHYAESTRIMDCLAAGDFDFWNPSANGGYASLYYYQAIPQLASAVPAAVFGNHLFWFQLSVVLPLILAPACAYKGMRLLGATPWQSLAAAFCVAFMNGESRWGSGNAGTFNVGLYTQTWALCAFPLALGYIVRWVTQGINLAAAVAWMGFVFLCHPMIGIALAFAMLIVWTVTVVLRFVVDPLLRTLAPRFATDGRLYRVFAVRWSNPPDRHVWPELWRSAVFVIPFALTMAPIALPLLIDPEGFGGFPHRVSDEVGPGFGTLWTWFSSGHLLDFTNKNLGMRLDILTWAFPIVLVLARGRFVRWLWAPVFLYALLLGLGPKMGKIGDDLIPPVRFLGAMQTLMAMGIGAGAVRIGTALWELAGRSRNAYAFRTAIAAATAALVVLVAVPGGRALAARIRVFGRTDTRRPEVIEIVNKLQTLPQGRKQAGPGAENHWVNMLPYVWARIPATIQMGGGGLQASPNYDFLWTMRDAVKNAWIYDAPYLLFQNARVKNVPNGETVIKTKTLEVRRLPSPGLVSPVTVVGVLPPGYSHKEEGHKKALEWVKSDMPMKDEVLAYAGSGGPGPKAQGKTLRAWRQDSPGDDADIIAEVEAQAPTTFIVRESWHPRWHAYVDGEEVPVRRVTPDFSAVDVAGGAHTIEMRFERPWWAHASWLAWPLPPLAIWLVTRRRRRRSAAVASPGSSPAAPRTDAASAA